MMNNKELTELYHEQFNRIKQLESVLSLCYTRIFNSRAGMDDIRNPQVTEQLNQDTLNTIAAVLGKKGEAMMKERLLEHCFICDEPTDRAGKSDDSIYCDECDKGPYCPACFRKHHESDVKVAALLEALWTISNDCVIVLDGDDMSGMSDAELFGAMLITATEAIRKATE